MNPNVTIPCSLSFQDLRRVGLTRAEIEQSIAAGAIVRARRGVYVRADASPAVREAAAVGGRLDCVSAMREMGVFVLERSGLHIQVARNRKHLRIPPSGRVRVGTRWEKVCVYWRDDEAQEEHLIASPVLALAQAVRCQTVRAAVATIDSALHVGVIHEHDLGDLFARLPRRFRRLRRLVDGRAESGAETLARLLMRAFGRRVEVQKVIDGVGRVDLVVDGWLVIECDSREFHGGWERQEADRLRDLKLAALGYATIRPTARMIFDEPEILIRAVQGLLVSR